MKSQPASGHSDQLYRSIYQSADYAVKELLQGGEDPLALASYLSTLQQNNLLSVKSDGLSQWGLLWIQRIFVERQIGERRDEEIASAALLVVALDGKQIAGMRDQVRQGIADLLSIELDRSTLPLRRPSYASALLLAAHAVGITDRRIGDAAVAVGRGFQVALPGGRLFGLALCVRLLLETNAREPLESLVKAIRSTIADSRNTYEDNIYLLEALWQLSPDEESLDEVLKTTQRVLAGSPAWAYLMVGMEDVPAASDGHDVVRLSHLFRSSLLDVTVRYLGASIQKTRALDDERLKGNRGVSILAFGFPCLFFAIIWSFYLYWMIPLTNGGLRFWIQAENAAVSPAQAILFLGGTILFPYLVVISPVIIIKLFQILVRQGIQSDRRVSDALWKPVWKITAVWLTLIVLALIINLASGVLGPRLQYLIDALSRTR
jgi:hypothetical protein